MISKKTVFILGAGASEPFGFPIGSGLRKNILEELNLRSPKLPPRLKIFGDLGYSANDLSVFREAFLKSQKFSIDAFLEHRPEFIELGKILITYNILRYEKIDEMYINSNWYGFIWNKLNCPFEKFSNNKISFITFNYDRSLETYLLNSMMALFNKSEEECQRALESIPILHVHGQIGNKKPSLLYENISFGEKISDFRRLSLASQGIKIIHENIASDKEFTLAQNLIQESELTVILGLGYDETNLSRLRIMNTSTSKYSILGSSYGLTDKECAAIRNKFPIIDFPTDHTQKALEFLRHNVILE